MIYVFQLNKLNSPIKLDTFYLKQEDKSKNHFNDVTRSPNKDVKSVVMYKVDVSKRKYVPTKRQAEIDSRSSYQCPMSIIYSSLQRHGSLVDIWSKNESNC